MSRDFTYLTCGNKTLKRPSPFRICAGWDGLLVSPETPRPRESARVHCVAGEGWSPAEPEHWGEASRRRSCAVRRAVRIASPLATQPDGPRIARADGITCAACPAQGVTGHAPRGRRSEVASRLVSARVRVDNDDDGRARDDDNGGPDDNDAAAHAEYDHHRRRRRPRRRPQRPRRRLPRRRARRPVRPRGIRRHLMGTAPARRCPSVP